LSPDKAAIESNINRALFLVDKSAYKYYSDMAEKGYYNRIISGNINQTIAVDSVALNLNAYPYHAVTGSLSERTKVLRRFCTWEHSQRLPAWRGSCMSIT
ncbi:hypothetical protein EZS27_037467, partial [termite gut metagenome]